MVEFLWFLMGALLCQLFTKILNNVDIYYRATIDAHLSHIKEHGASIKNKGCP